MNPLFFQISKATHLGFLILIVLFFIGCASEEPETNISPLQTDTSVTSLSSAKPWKGAAEGYQSTGDSTDRIELVIRLGELLAAALVYQRLANDNRDMSSGGAEPDLAGVGAVFDENLMARYAEISPVIQSLAAQSNQELSLQSYLNELRQPEQIAAISSGDRNMREERNAANQKVLDFMSRIHAVVLAFFPSRHEYFMASSALIRVAGDKMASAVSANGVVLDARLFQQAFFLIDRSTKLDPKNVTFCESQRDAIRSHKRAIDNLLNKMPPVKEGERLTVTATDVYRIASQAAATGKRFPVKDSADCG